MLMYMTFKVAAEVQTTRIPLRNRVPAVMPELGLPEPEAPPLNLAISEAQEAVQPSASLEVIGAAQEADPFFDDDLSGGSFSPEELMEAGREVCKRKNAAEHRVEQTIRYHIREIAEALEAVQVTRKKVDQEDLPLNSCPHPPSVNYI
jgi:hypothetical protein